jgi:hypothetical protein
VELARVAVDVSASRAIDVDQLLRRYFTSHSRHVALNDIIAIPCVQRRKFILQHVSSCLLSPFLFILEPAFVSSLESDFLLERNDNGNGCLKWPHGDTLRTFVYFKVTKLSSSSSSGEASGVCYVDASQTKLVLHSTVMSRIPKQRIDVGRDLKNVRVETFVFLESDNYLLLCFSSLLLTETKCFTTTCTWITPSLHQLSSDLRLSACSILIRGQAGNKENVAKLVAQHFGLGLLEVNCWERKSREREREKSKLLIWLNQFLQK